MALTQQMYWGGGDLDYNGLLSYCAEFPNERACRYLDGIDLDEVQNHGTVDERVHAIVPMSPGLWYTFGEDGEGLSSIENSLIIAGTNDSVLGYDSEAIPTYSNTGSPKYLATFENTGHYAFTNICDLIPIFTDECTEESWADISQVQQLSEVLVTAFVDYHAKGTDFPEQLSNTHWEDDPLISIQEE